MIKTMKTYEAITLHETFKAIIESKRQLPGTIAWALSRSFQSLDQIKKDFDKMRAEKVMSLMDEGKAHKVEDTDNVQVNEENIPEFVNYLDEISMSDVDVNCGTFSQSAFDNLLENYEFTVEEISAIGYLLKED